MLDSDTRIGVHDNFPARSIDIYMDVTRDGKSHNVTTQFTLVQNDDYHTLREPTLRMDRATAQDLMNELYRAGLRPNNGEGTSAQVEALKYHLEDMRKLVFTPPLRAVDVPSIS